MNLTESYVITEINGDKITIRPAASNKLDLTVGDILMHEFGVCPNCMSLVTNTAKCETCGLTHFGNINA